MRARPAEHFLEEGISDAAPTPCGFDPHTTNPTRAAALSIKKPVRRAEDIFAFTREEHHMPAGLGDRTGELLPIGEGLRRRVGERFAKGIRSVAQGAQAETAVEIRLI